MGRTAGRLISWSATGMLIRTRARDHSAVKGHSELKVSIWMCAYGWMVEWPEGVEWLDY